VNYKFDVVLKLSIGVVPDVLTLDVLWIIGVGDTGSRI